MKLVFLGPPGVGKGTHAKIVSEKYGIPHFATGDILRQNIREGTELGKQAKTIMEEGGLVSDNLVNAMIFDKISASGIAKGFILDGYPRTLGQAQALDAYMKEKGYDLDRVFYFTAPEKVIIERLSGRRLCPNCGGNFHVKNIPPKKEGICDYCGKGLIQRKDDEPSTVRQRLLTYENETKPLVAYYSKKGLLEEVKGDMQVSEVQKSLTMFFDKLRLKV